VFDRTKVVQVEAGFVDFAEPVKDASNAAIKTVGEAATALLSLGLAGGA
jgi:hypothetical protein